MAKKFTHNVCERSFRTRNGLRTHVICEPVAKSAPAPKRLPVSDEKATLKRMIETATRMYMTRDENPLGFVKANIRARKLLATRIAATK